MTIRTKQEFIDSINVLLADNSSKEISPQDVRTSLTDLADSVHRFLENVEVNATNMSTPDSRTVRVGVDALNGLTLAGRTSADNTAVGYRSLYQNYNGVDNTAIGSQAASCNLYGNHLVAVGKNALAGNVTGSGNVGVGNFSGQSGKSGSFNIFLGHGAGNYIAQDQSYRLFIGSHAVNYTDLCDSATASGNAPTIFGDLENHKIAIGVNTLHDFGSLQVGGNVSATQNASGNLGHGSMNWKQLYLSSGIVYPSSGNFYIGSHAPKGLAYPDQYDITHVMAFTDNGIGIGTETPSGAQGLLTVGGNIVPSTDTIYRLGTPGLRWDAYLNDVHVSGNATINDLTYNTLEESVYEAMSIHMAVSGTGDPLSSGFVNNALYGYLPDGSLNGGGFFLHSAGVGYQRDYQFIFTEADQALTCPESDSVWARSHWKSNISLKVDDGLHVQTQRILGDSRLSLITQSGCNGIFVRTDTVGGSGNHMYFGEEINVENSVIKQNFAFYAPSGAGEGSTSLVSIASSGWNRSVGLDLATRVENQVYGFQIIHNDFTTGRDRLTFNRSTDDGTVREHITMDERGWVGITDKFRPSGDAAYFPSTNLEVVSSGNQTEFLIHNELLNRSILSITSNGGPSGMRMVYDATDDYIDFSVTTPSGATGSTYHENGFITVNRANNYVGLGQVFTGSNANRVTPNSPLTVYHTGSLSGTVAMKEQTDAPTATAAFGKIYVKPNVATGQTQSIYFMDDGGNIFDLTTGGGTDGLHYTNPGSTVVGSGSMANASSVKFSTVLGVNNATSGTALTSGVILGYNNLEYSTSTPVGVVLIGTSLYHNTTIPNNTLAIGHGESPLLTGNFSTRSFKVVDGDFSVSATNETTIFSIDHEVDGSVYDTVFDLKDTVNAATISGVMKFTFTDASDSSNTFATFNHQEDAMSNSPTYVGPASDRPYMQLEGDLKMRGALMFADGTYIDTADGRAVYGGTGLAEAVVGNGTLLHLNYTGLSPYSAYVSTLNNDTSYLGLNVDAGGGSYKMSRVTLAQIGSLLNSGDASVAPNCNMAFTNANTSINYALNSGSIFIGCNTAIGATGWNHTVMMGTEAGYGATTPNVGLATDTASVMIGYRAGKDADNVSNLIAIGTNAGNEARNAEGSIFIGQNAGYDIQVTDSIGIGENALRGTSGGGIGGEGNIEIVANMLDNQRLMYQNGNLSNRLNIQNTIAGHMGNRRVSIGDAILNPDAPLSARMDHSIPGHSGLELIQTWYCNDKLVASVDCSGYYTRYEDNNGTPVEKPDIIEGHSKAIISCPSGYQTPGSGLIIVRGENFITTTEEYVVHRDASRTIGSGVFVIAHKVNNEYRPIYIGCSGV